MRTMTDKLHVWHSVWIALLIVALAVGACSIAVGAQTPTPLTGGAVNTAVGPGITAATLQPTIAGGSANLPAGSQSTSGRPRIALLLVIVVVALIVLGGGFTFNRRRDQRLP